MLSLLMCGFGSRCFFTPSFLDCEKKYSMGRTKIWLALAPRLKRSDSVILKRSSSMPLRTAACDDKTESHLYFAKRISVIRWADMTSCSPPFAVCMISK